MKHTMNKIRLTILATRIALNAGLAADTMYEKTLSHQKYMLPEKQSVKLA